MSRDKIIDGLKSFLAVALLSVTIAITGASWATQDVARKFGYQRALDGRIVTINSKPLYQPFAILDWSKRWSRRYPKPFAVPKLIVSLSFIAALGVLFLAFRPRPPRQKPFGQDAWGDEAEAHALGLFADKGIVLGKLGGEILCHDGEAHVLLTGGTRSGKTRGAVVPTLLTWPGSAIVLDVKDELHSGDPRHGFPGTAGFRSRLGPVIRLAFTQKDSACFNVLETVRIGEQEVHDVQNIVTLIADPHGDGRHKDFWDDSARSVIGGLIIHVLYAEKDKSLARVFRLLADFDATAKAMLSTYHLKDPLTGALSTHPVVERGATSYLANHEKLRAGIKSTAESYLTLYDDPLIQKHTSRSDFSISDLMCGERPVTLYLCWPPAEVNRLRPIIRLTLGPIWFGLMENQTKGPNGAPKQHRMLLLLDEFPQLGKLDFFEQSMGSMAGYDMRAFLVTQSLNFVEQAYGKDNTILDNCPIVAAYAATDSRSAQKISDLVGEHIEMRAQETWSGRASALSLNQRAITYKEEKRALLPPGEVRALPQDEQVILPEGGGRSAPRSYATTGKRFSGKDCTPA